MAAWRWERKKARRSPVAPPAFPAPGCAQSPVLGALPVDVKTGELFAMV